MKIFMLLLKWGIFKGIVMYVNWIENVIKLNLFD